MPVEAPDLQSGHQPERQTNRQQTGEQATQYSAESDAPESRQISATPTDVHDGVGGWLAWLHPLLPDSDWMAVVEAPASAASTPVMHSYPTNRPAPAAAVLLAHRARASGRVTAVRLNREANTGKSLLAIPLKDVVTGILTQRVLLLSGAPTGAAQRAACVRLCQWASAWLTVDKQRPQASTGLPTAVLDALQHGGGHQAVAQTMVNTLKRLHDCQRVSLATRRPGSSTLTMLAISDQHYIDARKVVPSQLLAAMRECVDSSIPRRIHRPLPTPLAVQFPASMTRLLEQGMRPSMTCVHFAPDNDKQLDATSSVKSAKSSTLIVIMLERAVGRPFSDSKYASLSAEVSSSCQLLADKLHQQTPLWQRILERLRCYLDWQVIRRSARRRLLVAVMGVLLVSLLFAPVPQRVSARATIEARDMQVVVAPHAGILASAHVRAGDLVRRDQLLATLDDHDLQLSAGKWQAEARKNEQALDLALASRDRVELGRIRADTARIDAERALIERQLTRARLRAPFDGVVLSGDLSQQLGSSLMQGDTLFSIGASDAYRLVLAIDERDVALIQPGQAVRVRMAAMPERVWQASVETVLPVAHSVEQKIVFKVPALLNQQSDLLRPGMEGVARLEVGSGPLVQVHTRRLRDTVNRWLWHLGLIR